MVKLDTLPGFEEFIGYGITSCGRVWSYKTNRFLTPNYDQKGYEEVFISNGGKRRHVRVHRLVALAYLQNPDNLETVDHINNNKRENHTNNLQWMSRSDNSKKSNKI